MKHLGLGVLIMLAACMGDPARPEPSPLFPPSDGPTGYSVEAIELPDTLVQGLGLSDSGVVGLGVHRGKRLHVFRWHEGVLEELAVPDNEGGRVLGVSVAGHIVAVIKSATGSQLLIWDIAGNRRLHTTPDAAGYFDSPFSINARGDVAAQLTEWGNTAIIIRAGLITELPHLLATQTLANDLNSRGQVVGALQRANPAGDIEAFLWDNGQMRDMRTLGGRRCTDASGAGCGSLSAALSINESGDVVGMSEDSVHVRPVLWRGGCIQDLAAFPGEDAQATIINDRAQIVGNTLWDEAVAKAFFWESGVARDLGSLGGGGTVAMGLNQQGVVVGWSRVAGGARHAFAWQDGAMRDLGSAEPGETRAVAVNSRGDILMIAGPDWGQGRRALFVRRTAR